MEAFLAAAGCLLMLPVVAALLFFAFRERDGDRDRELCVLRAELEELRRRTADHAETP